MQLRLPDLSNLPTLPSPRNLPPRVLRLLIGCTALFVLVITTVTLVVSSFHGSSDRGGALATQSEGHNVTFPLEPELMSPSNAWWTTEQQEIKFAYAQYATTLDYLCNAIINFNRLRRYGAKHDLVLIFPTSWTEGKSTEAKAINFIRINLPQIKLRPFDVISTMKGDATWRDSLTKFHCFALTEWSRVLAFDSDSQVLNSMDHYFLSPMAPVAVPRAYWLTDNDADIGKQILGSHVMLIEPNEARYHKVMDEALKSGDFDMEVINHMFKDSAMILPHRRLALLTGEFRSKDHSRYMAPDVDEEWNAMGEVSRAVLVHFSDWPLPKPWKPRSKKLWEETMPECDENDMGAPDRPPCDNRMMWTGFYSEYERDREHICADLLA